MTLLPLEGIRVLDLTSVLAGPMCTMMLADAGADVIKVEPPTGDAARGWGPPFVGGQGAEFMALNRNKRSIVLDLKTGEGRGTFLELCTTADVIVENYRTGVMERLGIGYEVVREINPALIYCSISGFGRTGPRAEEAAYDAVMQAFVGIMASTGIEGADPVRVNTSLCDISAGMYANQAILLALLARGRTGRGQRVEASLFESQIAWLNYRAVGYFATGQAPARKMGSAAPHIVPYEAFRASDDWLMVAALNDSLFVKLARAIGNAGLADDERFRTNPERVINRVELGKILRDVLKTKTRSEWIEVFAAAGVPCSPINTIEDVLQDHQTEARNMIATVALADGTELKMPGIPIKMSATPGTIRTPPPQLGADTDAVLAEARTLARQRAAN